MNGVEIFGNVDDMVAALERDGVQLPDKAKVLKNPRRQKRKLVIKRRLK